MKKILTTILAIAAIANAAFAFKVDTISVNTSLLERPMDALVVIPDAAAADSSYRFPVLYLLHGYTGNYTEWVRKSPDLGRLADEYRMIVVTPDGRDS